MDIYLQCTMDMIPYKYATIIGLTLKVLRALSSAFTKTPCTLENPRLKRWVKALTWLPCTCKCMYMVGFTNVSLSLLFRVTSFRRMCIWGFVCASASGCCTKSLDLPAHLSQCPGCLLPLPKPAFLLKMKDEAQQVDSEIELPTNNPDCDTRSRGE